MHSINVRQSGLPRSGFTLVELLMVVVIIGILLGLTVRVIGAFVSQSREAATTATIRKIHGLLSSRAETLHRMEKRTKFVESTPEFKTVQKDPKLKNASVNLQKICAIKLLSRKYFPQRKDEVDSTLQPKIAALNAPTSSEILYDFLTQSNVLGDSPVGTDTFSTAELRDVDNNGYPEFVDAWGNKLRFYRCPTRLFRTDGYGSVSSPNPIDATNAKLLFSTLPSFSGDVQKDLGRDPDDPLRLAARAMPTGTDFETIVVQSYTGACFHTPATYHVMLVVSAGPDGVLGMYEPEDVANNGHLGKVRDADALADDITYLNIRAGGR